MPRRLRIGLDAPTGYELVCLPGSFTSTGQDANLVHSGGSPALNLLAPVAVTTGVAAGGLVQNQSAEARTWTLASPSGATLTPSSGTTPAGGSTAFTVQTSAAGPHTLTLTDTGGGTVTGSPAAFTAVPAAAAPTDKYRFQQPLLFQRAHAKSEPLTYTSLGGTTVSVPNKSCFFGGYTASGVYPNAGPVGSDVTFLCATSRWRWVNNTWPNCGDWLDATLAPQGSTAWATSATIPSGTPAGNIALDVSAMIAHADTTGRWYALFIMVTGSGTLSIVGPVNTTGATKSTLDLVRGGVPETRNLWYACSLRNTPNDSYRDAQDDFVNCTALKKVAMEFYRPADQSVAASTAMLNLRHNGVSGGSVVVKVFMVNAALPDISAPTPGLAAAYPLDAGIFSHPDVVAAMRVTDTTVLGDVVNTAYTGLNGKFWDGVPFLTQQQECYWDPTLWGTPGVDAHLAGVSMPSPAQMAQLVPHRGITAEGTKLEGAAYKSAVVGDTIRVLTGADLVARGLPVLAPGMGAFEMTYASTNLLNGQGTLAGTTTGGDLADGVSSNSMEAYFKREHIGKVVDGYCRMHVMLAEGFECWDGDLMWNWIIGNGDGALVGKYPEDIGYSGATVSWRPPDMTGKFPGGIQQLTSSQSTTAVPSYLYPTRLDGSGNVNTTPVTRWASGGYSNTSGPYGYQGRWQFATGHYKEGFEGPARNGAAIGIEMYDFGQYDLAIPSQVGIASWDANGTSWAGHIGGMGFLYTRKWYCVEMRWKMNTVPVPYVEPAPGTHYLEIPPEHINGFIEWWIDGVKSATTPVFAHRSSRMVDWLFQVAAGAPFDTNPGSPSRLRMITNVPLEVYGGASSIVLQTYAGGQSPNPRNRRVLINGLVATSGQYIGPMAGVSRANGGLGA